MKIICKINYVTIIIAGLLISSSAQVHAQEKYKTNERVGKQLKQNSAPGLKYGPELQQRQEQSTADPKRDTKGDIRAILFTGGMPSTVGQTLKTKSVATAKKAQSALPSDAKLPEPDQKKAAPPKLPPMQTEEKREN